MTTSRANTKPSILLQVARCCAIGSGFSFLLVAPIFYQFIRFNPELTDRLPHAVVGIFWLTLSYLILGCYAGIAAFVLSKLLLLAPAFRIWEAAIRKVMTLVTAVGFYWLSQNLLKSPYYHSPLNDAIQHLILAYSIMLLILGIIEILTLKFRKISIAGLVMLPFFAVIGLMLLYGTAAPVPLNAPDFDSLALEATTNKIRLLGIDGLTWDLCHTLNLQGRLPVFGRLAETGCANQLQSLRPLKSPMIWTSICTGKTASKHGIEDFEIRGIKWGGGYIRSFPSQLLFGQELGFFPVIPITSGVRKAGAFWNILSATGISSVTIGWWATWPAEPVKGIMLSDRLELGKSRKGEFSGAPRLAYPESMGIILAEFIPEPEMIPEEVLSGFISPQALTSFRVPNSDPRNLLTNAWSKAVGRFELSEYLAAKYDPALLAGYVPSLDYVSHLFWQSLEPKYYPDSTLGISGKEVIPKFYAFIDSLLSSFIRDAPHAADIIILSDHGFGPATPAAEDRFAAERYVFHSGIHEEDGVLVVNGPHFRVGRGGRIPSILDILPTVLRILDLPHAEDMDGMVLKDCLISELSACEIPPIATYDRGGGTYNPESSVLDEELLSSLEELGYLR